MSFKVFALFALLAVSMVLAQHEHQEEQYAHEPHYAYEYAVHDDHTNDIHSHKESRKGDRTEGEYSLVEADGTIRTVKYHVDGKSGFVAEVTHSGHAVHAAAPVHVAHVAPVHVAHVAPIAIAKPALVAYKPLAFHHAGAATSYVQNGHYNHGVNHY